MTPAAELSGLECSKACDLCEKISGENRDHSRGGRCLLGVLLRYERSKGAGA